MNATRSIVSTGCLALAFALSLTGCDFPGDQDSDSDSSSTTNSNTTGVDSASDTAQSTTGDSAASDSDSHGTCDEGTEGSTGEGSTGTSDLPPIVAITMPETDLLGNDGPVYDGFDDTLGLYYVDVELTASAADPEDGDLSSSIEWTTDGTTVQDASLGSGPTVTTRLYSDDCFGFLHTVSATVTDSDGNASAAQRQLFIWTLC